MEGNKCTHFLYFWPLQNLRYSEDADLRRTWEVQFTHQMEGFCLKFSVI